MDGLTSPTYGYQWVRVDADGTSNPTDITGATSATYKQVEADVGRKLRVTVSFTDDDGKDEGRTSEPTATVLDTPVGICGRTPQVRDALVALIHGVSNCADVTAPHLAAITGKLELFGQQITALAEGDFAGLTSLTHLSLHTNALTTLPTGVFAELTSLTRLSLYSNALTRLPTGVFAELTALTELKLGSNQLSTLPDGVFDGLTSLTQLYLNNNELTTLDDDVFEPLTALTALRLRDNPGAPFAPEAVALPDDGTVSAAGGTVTLDGSGSGGPWGTNVTYGWALTDPVSGVTVTFDDDTSATPVVTIPALAEGTGRTFTLTVTGRGGTDGSVPATDTATVTAISDDATLSALTVNDGTNDLTLAPAFASGTFAYAADVAHAVDEVTLSATVNHAGASVSAVTLNGTAVADSDFTDGITVPGLLAGGNDIVVTVTVEDTSATRTYTVTVTANTAPTALDALITTNEDTAYTFGAADFNFDDTDTGDALASVTVVTLLAAGALELDGTAVTTGQSVPAADIGKLVFTPVANGNGDAYARFTFRVHDGTDESAASYVMTVNVTAMNDPATGAPAISGTGQVGMVLTASPGTIADADGLAGVSYSYQWIQVDGAAETEIGAANTGSYTPVRADVGKTLKVRASFTDADSNDEGRTSEPTATVTAAPTAPAIGDASASEGDAITFTVTLADAATRDVTVDYATSVAADDTAAQTDFTARSGTVTFAVGETVQTFTVSTLEDRIDESGETFTVTLDNVRPAGAATLPADPTATGTIMDDDAAPVLVLSVAPASIAESGGTSTVTVSTGTGSTFADEQTIALALSGTATEVEDYTISSKSLTLPAGVGSGASSVRATVTAEDDDIFGGAVNKQLSIAGSRRGANFGATRTITIIENEEAPKLTLTLTDDSISENGGSTTVTASVAPRIADAFTVTFGIDPTAPATAADYDLSGTLSFAALSDSPTGTVTIAANDNRVDRSDKTVSVTGRSSRSYFRATEAVTLTIEDEDAPPVPVLEVSTSSIAENGGTSIVTVTTGTGSTYATDQAIMLSLSGTATVAGDYSVDSTLTLLAGVGSGASTVTTTVTGVDDRIDDDDETVVINASRGGTGFGSPQTVAITDDDAAPVLVFSALPASIAENGGVSTVTVGTGTGSTYATAQTITLAVAGTAIEGSDYTIGSRTLTLPVGVGSIASSVTTPVTGLDDGLFEGEADQTVLVTATHDGTDAGTPQTVAVVDDEANSKVVLTLTPDTIEEARAPGNPNANSATVTATVSPPAEHPFVVQLGVEPNAPATANDYTTAFPVPSFGLLDFAAEATASTGLATIYAVDNDVDTPDKTLTISGSIGAYDNGGQGLRAPRTTGIRAPAPRTLTLRDDDEAADTVSLSLDVTSVAEAAGPTDIEVTATLNSGARESAVVVTVTVGGGTGDDGAVSGADFNPVEAFTLSILAGETSVSADFTLTPLDDRIHEPDEVLSVVGAANDSLVGVPEAAGITITDNDEAPVLTLEVAPDLIAEDGGTATVTVSTGTGSTFADEQTITLSLSGSATTGADYAISAQTLTLPAGSGANASSVTAAVTAVHDGVFEGDETLVISGQADGAAFGEQQTLTITDNEGSPQVALVLSPGSIAEDGGVSKVTATVSPASAEAFTVAVASAPVSPAEARDFQQPGTTLSFAAGATLSSGSVTIAAVNNTADTPNRQVSVSGTVTAPGVLAPADATLTILDDEGAAVLTLEVAPATIAEDGGTATVTVTTGTGSTFGSAQAITLVLGGTATQGEDYTVSATQLTLPADAASVTATVTGLDDGVFEGDETLLISGQADGAAFGEQQTLTITDNEGSPQVRMVLSPGSIAEDGGVSTVTATVSPAPAEAFTVTVAATADAPATEADFTLTGATLSFAANAAESTGEVMIAAVDNGVDAANKTVRVTGSVSSTGIEAPVDATLTILDDEGAPVLALEVAPATIAEDGGTATVTVTTGTGSTFGSAQAITLVLGGTATQGEDYTVSATQLTLPADAASVTATVTGLDDGVLEGDETLLISGQADGAAFGEQQTLTITDNEEAPRVTLVLSPDSIAEDGGVSTVTATVSPASAEAFTVTVAATADAPAAGSDFTLTGATLSFAANAAESTGEVTIAAVDNDEDTPDKSVTISGTVSLDGVTAPAGATLTIADNDEPPSDDPGVDIARQPLTTVEGDEAGSTFSVKLTVQPVESVTVTVLAPPASGLTVVPPELVFTPDNWNVEQTVTVTAAEDADTKSRTVPLSFAATGAGYEDVPVAPLPVTVIDASELPELRVADARGREAEGQLIFDLTLNRAAEQAVSVAFATRDGTARAGEDYDALAGTATIAAGARATRIAVPVRVDLFREADESFLLMLSGADGARLADGEAIGVIEDEAALASQWLARFGRLAGDHVMAAVEEQITAPRGDASHVTVAGHRLTGGTGSFDTGARGLDPLGQPGFGRAPSLQAAGLHPATGWGWQAPPGERPWSGDGGMAVAGFGSAGAGDRFGPAGRTLSGRDLLANSAFLLNAGPGGGQGASVWGRGDYTRFDHLGEGLQGGGEALSATVGVDWACARCLIGIALSHTAVEAGYGASGRESGTLESSVTGLYPYFGVQLAERFSVWGLAGQGQGELIPAPATGARTEKLDIETGLAGFGARAELISPDKAFSLAVKTEAFVSHATSGEAEGILEAEGEWRRVRLGLEGSWLAEFDTGASLRSSLEVAALQDAGDAENGRGAEVGASLRLIDVAPGLSLSVGVRGLVSHESEEYEEWGGSGGLRYDPEPGSAAGPLISLTHSWGAAQSGGLQQALRGNGLSRPPMPLLARREEQLSAEFAWGFEAFGALGVPWARVGTAGAGEDYRVGYSLFTHRGIPSLELGRSALGREVRVGWALTVRCRAQVAVQVLNSAAGPGERTNTGFELTLRSIAPGGRPGAASCDTLQPLFTSGAPR